MTGPPSIAKQRLISQDVSSEALEPDGVSAALATSSATMAHAPGCDNGLSEVGLWEAGPGDDVDTEVDEIFLVLSGTGTVTFEDGSALDLRPGVLVRLVEGDRTTWSISERLRKLYLA